ncbi:MAG TPA: winged helix-turn-helix domain-containing protein [Mycobacteriales bacterium]|nr:winged helix-turn-helix domain-containing protein [Mycobacteriales bacterium]
MSARAGDPKGDDTPGEEWRPGDARPLTNAREIRAIAHPVRIALLEALSREGPLTATQAAEIVDESPANCSFHLRTLAKYGFVEEAGGSGRQRPWRRVSLGQSLELTEEGEAGVAAQAFAHLAHERTFSRISNYVNTASTYPQGWHDASFMADWLVYVTPEELAEIQAAVLEQMSRFRERTGDRSLRPEGSRAVQLAAYGFPLPPTASGN